MNRARHIAIVLLAAAVAAATALAAAAQQAAPAQQAAAATPAQQASYLASVKPVYDIVILGDVLGTGLWAGMNRVVEGDDRITVTGRIQENSGLARPKLYDWSAAAATLLESRPFDIAAIVLGANDARDINTDDGALTFGTPEWRTAYAAQIKSLVDVLRANRVAVYWFGVPPMANPSYDEAMKVVAEVERQAMAELGVRHIDLQLLMRGADGSYTDSGDDGTGEVVRLRSRDGIKFITRGNDRLAAEFMKLVRADISVAEGAAPASGLVAVMPEVQFSPEQLAALPAFGAEMPDSGEPVLVDPAQLPGPDFVELATLSASQKVKPGEALFANTRQATDPGSDAHRLYVDGLWPETDKGASDPFTALLPQSN